MTEVPVGDAGKLSKPAQLRYSSKPTPRESSADTKSRLLTQTQLGFHDPEPLIALGSHPPQLPGRN